MEGKKLNSNANFLDCSLVEKIELALGNTHEVVVEDGKTFIVRKKPQYHKTYEECCEVLGIDVSRTIGHSEDLPFYSDVTCYENNLLSSLAVLRKLLICRDAYWKLAGKQMGLGKPWEPDWNNDEIVKYCIIVDSGIISKQNFRNTQFTFVFPTEEMRDAFYENFKELIEECKELL